MRNKTHSSGWSEFKSECFFHSLSPFLFLLVEIFCVCFSLILELKMLNLFVAGRCIFRGSCCFFFDSWAREVYMCGYFFCASSSYMSSGLILFLFLAVCVWVYVLFFFFLFKHIHMQCIYNLPDKREKKSYSSAKCHWNCFYSLVVSSLSFFLISVLHNRISLCVCLLCTQFTHTNPAAHIFPLSKSNAWRGKNSHFISGDLFKVMTQSKIIRCFATMCACTCVLDWMKHIKCKKITNKLKKGEWKKERKENEEADDNSEHQHQKQQIR